MFKLDDTTKYQVTRDYSLKYYTMRNGPVKPQTLSISELPGVPRSPGILYRRREWKPSPHSQFTLPYL